MKGSVRAAVTSMCMSLQMVIGLSGKKNQLLQSLVVTDNVNVSRHCAGLFQTAKNDDQEIISPASYILRSCVSSIRSNVTQSQFNSQTNGQGDEDDRKYFRRIHLIKPQVGSMLLDKRPMVCLRPISITVRNVTQK
jgi:hypothetical protein